MAEEKKNRNFVLLSGYLKETTLDMKSTQDGRRFVSGNITVAVDEFNTHRVRFLVFEDQFKDRFDNVCQFLPSNTISIASYLKANPTANFAVSANMAAKVWVTGSLEEYVKQSGEVEKSSVTINGMKIGTADPEKFDPKATFELAGDIASIEDEVDDDDKTTGRLNLGLYVPAYKDLLYKVSVVVPTENNAAKYVKEKYKVGDGILLKGDLVAMRHRILNDDAEDQPEDAFGAAAVPQYTTRFIREMVVKGGNKIDSFFTKEQVTKGLVVRTEVAQKRGQKQKERAAAAAEAPVEAPAAPAAANPKDDFDF